MIKRVYDRSMGAGFKDSAPATNPLLREVPPPMAAEASPGMSQRLTLDRPSFEKLLAAAWVLQCLHDQLHSRQVGRDETIAEPVKTQKGMETAGSGLQVVMKPVVQPSPRVTEVESKHEVLSGRPADDETLAELVEAQQAIETGTLDLDAAVKRVVALSLKLTRAEGAAVWLFAQDEFSYRAGAGTASDNEKLRLAVLSSLAGAWPGNGKLVHGEASASKQSWVADLGTSTASLLVAPIYHGREVAGALAAFTKRSDSFSGHNTTTVRLMSGLLSHALRKAAEVELKTVEPRTVEPKQNGHPEDAAGVQIITPLLPALEKLVADDKEPARHGSSFKLRTAFDSLRDAFSNHRPTFRVNLTLRALRAAAIATPVLLLAIVAALLLLETWRHGSFHSAQAISRPSPPTEEAVVSETSTTLITTTRGAFEGPKRTDRKPRWSRPVPPLEVSHKHITDPATLSVVQQLSRYEISGLRRRAKYGDDSAAFTLGMAYEVGRYVPQNCAQAARWVTTAAEAGDAAAQYNLGLRFRGGDGVSADRAESEKWLRKAAAHRNQQARLALKILASR